MNKNLTIIRENIINAFMYHNNLKSQSCLEYILFYFWKVFIEEKNYYHQFCCFTIKWFYFTYGIYSYHNKSSCPMIFNYLDVFY